MNTSDFRVLQVTGTLNVGGAETMAVTLAEQMVSRGIAVDFLVFAKERGPLEEHVESLGCGVIRADRPTGVRRFSANSALVQLMTDRGPFDVVHSHVNRASGAILAAAHRAEVPIRLAHSHFSSDSGRGLAAAAYRRLSDHLISKHATGLVACAEEAGLHLFGEVWAADGCVIPNSVNVEPMLAARSERDATRAELNVDSDEKLIGAVGRLYPVKNHGFLLDVMELLADQKVRLVIAGEGPLRSELEGEIRNRCLDGRVELLGLRRDIPQLLAAMDFLVMPSLSEGLPTSLVEAQASGVRTLVSDTITEEVDLGLGLVSFLPLDSPSRWANEITRAPDSRPSAELVTDRFRTLGYDAASATDRLLEIYGLNQ